MQLLTVILLWCFNGAALGSGGAMPEQREFNWPHKPDCNKKPDLTHSCGKQVFERRFYHDSKKNKCIAFIRSKCDDDITYGKFFENRGSCIRECVSSKSLCLKFRKGKMNGTFEGYSYDARDDICYPARYRRQPNFWPAENIFRTEQECYNECAPSFVQHPLWK